MRKLLSTAAAVASLFAMGAAHADLLLVDNFTTPTPAVSATLDTTVDGLYGASTCSNSIAGQIATDRCVSENLTLAGTPFGGSSISVGGGALGIFHGDNNSDVKVVWTTKAFSAPATASSLSFNISFNDAGNGTGTTLTFNFTGGSGFSKVVNTSGTGTQSFTLTAAEVAAFSAGGTLTMVATGSAGWDFVLKEFNIAIPEPTSLALAGLALVGAGVASRRRKA